MSIGENVKKIRIEKNITQKQLSVDVGITQAMLSQIERGTKAMSLPIAKQISEILHCSIYDFFDKGA